MIARTALAALVISASASAAKPIIRTSGQCWAIGWVPPYTGEVVVASGDRRNADLLGDAVATAYAESSLLWYPWVFPRRQGNPTSTPMSDCFAAARETCRAGGEKVCFAYYIEFPSGGFSCNFGCSVNGICGEPPPIPPVPQNGIAADYISALLVQEVMFALWHED